MVIGNDQPRALSVKFFERGLRGGRANHVPTLLLQQIA
jgi:hypothetical protein